MKPLMSGKVANETVDASITEFDDRALRDLSQVDKNAQ
jgi:hypothetical protein